MGNAMWSDEEIERHTDSSISKAIKPLENELAFIKQELFEERSLHEATKLCLKAQSDSVLGCAEKVKRLNHQLAQVTQERDALEMSLNKWRAISRDQETELAQAQQAIVKVTNEFNWANKHLHEAQQREVQAHRIFAWLLGEEGDFPDEPEPLAGKYRQRFWWRKELREKMNTLTPSPMSTHPTRSDIGDSVCQMEEGKP